MSTKNSKLTDRIDKGVIEVKSKFDAEFRRFSLPREPPAGSSSSYEAFYRLVESVHRLQGEPFVLCYTDPIHGDLLPINNDNNFARAVGTAKPMLRLLVQMKGQSIVEVSGYGTLPKKKNPLITKVIKSEVKLRQMISLPEDFRRVSAIIDVDVIPEAHRRVKLMKNGSDKPLGFYIRDGTSVRVTPHGLEKVPGIFISRLVPGGLAESTGLLAVNDEVLEVNGIEVTGKTLDQVTDMMVANSSNLIVTVKPVNQRNNIFNKGSGGRQSQKSTTSLQSAQSAQSGVSGQSYDSDEVRDCTIEEEDEVVVDHLQVAPLPAEEQQSPSVASKDSIESSNTNKDSSSPSEMVVSDEVLVMEDATEPEVPPGGATSNSDQTKTTTEKTDDVEVTL